MEYKDSLEALAIDAAYGLARILTLGNESP
jgi:hypothetical protein